MTRKNNISVVAILAGFCALYAFFSFRSWHEPIMGDQTFFITAIMGLNDPAADAFFCQLYQGAFEYAHPPGYIFLERAITGIAGTITPLTLRLAGILLFCVSLTLIYLLMTHILKDVNRAKNIALFSCFLYTINPFVIRGSLLVDIDGTLLNAALLLLMYVLAKMPVRAHLGYYALGGASCALVLWSKLPGTILFFSSTLAYFFLRKDFQKIVRVITIAVIGGTIFFITWFAYCRIHSVPPGVITEVPFQVVDKFIKVSTTQQGRMFLLRNIWAPLVWAWPSFAILAALSLIRIFREKHAPAGLISLPQLGFYGICVACAYVLLGGVTHSFPKYHYAMMPVFAMTVAYFLMQEISFKPSVVKMLVSMFFILVPYYFFLVQDPLYTISYEWKRDIIVNGGRFSRSILIKEAVQLSLIALSILLTYVIFLWRKFSKPFLLALLATTLAGNCSLSLVQMKARYQTVFCYGAEGVAQAGEFIRAHTDVHAPIFASPEFLVFANNCLESYELSNPSNKAFQGPGSFVELLNSSRVQCVAYGITGNTIAQYAGIFNSPPVQEFLRNNYTPHEIGSYTVWILSRRSEQ